MTGQAGMSVSQRHILRTLKYLNHRLILIAGNDTAKLFLLSIYYNFNNFYPAAELRFKPRRKKKDVRLSKEEMKELKALEEKNGASKLDDN